MVEPESLNVAVYTRSHERAFELSRPPLFVSVSDSSSTLTVFSSLFLPALCHTVWLQLSCPSGSSSTLLDYRCPLLQLLPRRPPSSASRHAAGRAMHTSCPHSVSTHHFLHFTVSQGLAVNPHQLVHSLRIIALQMVPAFLRGAAQCQ